MAPAKFAVVYQSAVGPEAFRHAAFAQCKFVFVETTQDAASKDYISIIRSGTRGEKYRLSKRALMDCIEAYNRTEKDSPLQLSPSWGYAGVLSGLKRTPRVPESLAFAECSQAMREHKSSNRASWTLFQLASGPERARKPRGAPRAKTFVLQYTCLQGEQAFADLAVFGHLQMISISTFPSPHDPTVLLSYIVMENKRLQSTVCSCIEAYNHWHPDTPIQLVTTHEIKDGYASVHTAPDTFLKYKHFLVERRLVMQQPAVSVVILNQVAKKETHNLLPPAQASEGFSSVADALQSAYEDNGFFLQ